MLSTASGWSRSGRHRAVLACVPGERHVLGLIGFGLALRDLGWRVTYLGADSPIEAVQGAADAVASDAIVLSVARTEAFDAAADDLRALAQTHAVAFGGSGIPDDPPAWLTTRTLPADPLVAAHALTDALGTPLSTPA
jgi:cobalamin-dependent methionine synthase I